MIKDLPEPYNRTVSDHLKQWLHRQLPSVMLQAADQRSAREPAADRSPRDAQPADRASAIGQADSVSLTPLVAEASHRKFYRVRLPDRSLVLMQSPPELERNDAFVALSRVFVAARIPVPQIYALDPAQGYFLMQDLGTRTLLDHYGTAAESAAVSAAIELLPRLQAVRSPHIPAYTRERLAAELQIFSDWFLEGLLQTTPPPQLPEVFEQLVDAAAAQPQVCVHRDYHCRNLLWNDGALGVVDFQDALHGPYSYDLASLLHDCYHCWPADALERYREQGRRLIAPDAEPAAFRRQLEWMAVQRQLKAIGIFARLKLRDARSSHLPHIVPTLEQSIGLTAGYSELEPLSRWLDSLLPEARQRLAKLEQPG